MAVVPTTEALGKLLLFRDLLPDQLSNLQRSLNVTTFPAGATIMTAEQPGEAVYLIVSGTVKVHVDRADGTEVMLAILGPGEVVGEMSVVDRHARSATVVAMEPSTLMWMDRTTFREALRTIPGLAMNLSLVLSRRLRLANAQIQALAGLDVYGRVARQLLALAEVYGEPRSNGSSAGTLINIRLTQSELAALVGASRVRVNQVLASFRQHDFIALTDPHRIVVRQAERLAEYCQ